MSAMVFSNGGRFVDPQGKPLMAEPGRGAVETAAWIRDGFTDAVIASDIAHLRVALARELSIARGEESSELSVEV